MAEIATSPQDCQCPVCRRSFSGARTSGCDKHFYPVATREALPSATTAGGDGGATLPTAATAAATTASAAAAAATAAAAAVTAAVASTATGSAATAAAAAPGDAAGDTGAGTGCSKRRSARRGAFLPRHNGADTRTCEGVAAASLRPPPASLRVRLREHGDCRLSVGDIGTPAPSPMRR